MDDLIARLEKREHYFRNASEGEYDANLLMKARFALDEQSAEITALKAKVEALENRPRGTRVRKISGPQWEGVVVGHYSSSFTPDGLVIECTVQGARGQVHVEPAKRVEAIRSIDPDTLK